MGVVSMGSTLSSSQSTVWLRSCVEWLAARLSGVRCSTSSPDRSWNAKRGMKPGEDGGTDPSTCFLRRRRSNAQQDRKSAAAPARPRGMPRPNPTFWPVESPASLAGGESGTEVDEGVVVGSTSGDVGEEMGSELGRSEDPVGRVDVDVRLETNVVGDPVGADAVALSLSLALE
jgi:hypothetical protein